MGLVEYLPEIPEIHKHNMPIYGSSFPPCIREIFYAICKKSEQTNV